MNVPTLFSYLPVGEARVICKLAEEAATPAEPKKKPHPLLPILGGAAAMGVGTLAGAGAAHVTDKLYGRVMGHPLPSPYLMAAAPVLGAGLGLAYNLAQAHQIEQLRHAAEDPNHKR